MKSGGFLSLLRSNRNYRFAWTGQVVSEAGDNFNNIAVFSLALANTGSGFVVAAILLSRAISMPPLCGVSTILAPNAAIVCRRSTERCSGITSTMR